MQTRRTFALGQKGAKKFLENYGEQLVCVHYRYDQQRPNAAPLSKSSSNESG